MKITTSKLRSLLVVGENLNIEFKRAGDGPKADTFESVCAFLNTAGGDLLLGVTDDGEVVGLPPKSIDAMIHNFVNVMNDSNLFDPVFTFYPQEVVYKGKHLIHVRVPESAEVHRFKGKCYARVHDEGDIFRLTVPLNAEHSPEESGDNRSEKPDRKAGQKNRTEKSDRKSKIELVEQLQQLVRTTPNITQDEMARLLGIARSTLNVHIDALKESGRIRRIGPDKGGHWEVIG